jgi:hypothetical protein
MAGRADSVHVVDDAGNSLNIYNLSNFKNFLTEYLLINIAHAICRLSIWSATTGSASHRSG